MSITMIGLDTAKSVFQIHAVDETGKTQIKRKLSRNDLVLFFTKQELCTVVMEACGAAHHWARILTGLGHDVKLIAPEAVKPFVKKGKKNDAADAAALCAAASRRGLATEFVLTVPKGIGRLEELTVLVDTDETFPVKARQAFAGLFDQCQALTESIVTFESEIVAHARHDETARRLATIPGIGPITASLIAATVGDIGMFKTARHFAAWLGLVPRQHSTGGKTRLGRITKTGNREIRKLLVLGATSMVYRAPQWNSAAGLWIRRILERRPVRLATVALANKMARIAWALMTRNEVYQAKGRVAAAAA
jgi:transposase